MKWIEGVRGITERTLSPRADDPLSDINLAYAITAASTARKTRVMQVVI